jgi:hypothetical protein
MDGRDEKMHTGICVLAQCVVGPGRPAVPGACVRSEASGSGAVSPTSPTGRRSFLSRAWTDWALFYSNSCGGPTHRAGPSAKEKKHDHSNFGGLGGGVGVGAAGGDAVQAAEPGRPVRVLRPAGARPPAARRGQHARGQKTVPRPCPPIDLATRVSGNLPRAAGGAAPLPAYQLGCASQ